MADAEVIPLTPEPGRRPSSGAGPSKAARLVGNTGPQPTTTEPHAHDPLLGVIGDRDLGETDIAQESWQQFFSRRLKGEYAVDDFGFDPELTDKVLLQVFRPLYRSWFRVEVSGIDHVPADSGALVVCNHSGVIAIDAIMTQVALHDEHPAHRHLRLLGADLVFKNPVMGDLARRAGHTLACNPDAERLLSAGEIVGVFPEGFKGIGKPFSQRYKLQRFGRGGFVAAALRTGTPIIPTAIIGAEETYPMIGNAGIIARLLGLPYFPLTPTFPWLGPLGAVPLPSKWHIHFGEPIPTAHYGAAAADDPMIVFNLTDQVREQIQQSLFDLLVQRPRAFG